MEREIREQRVVGFIFSFLFFLSSIYIFVAIACCPGLIPPHFSVLFWLCSLCCISGRRVVLF